jgi:hypothetical protein
MPRESFPSVNVLKCASKISSGYWAFVRGLRLWERIGKISIPLVALVVTVLVTGGKPLAAQVAYVQSGSKDCGTVTSCNLAFTSNNSPGNLLVVAVRSGSTTASVTITDSQGNAYATQTSQNQTTSGHKLTIAYVPNTKPGANTVTVAVSSSTTVRFAIHEYAGIFQASPVDASTSAQGSSTTPGPGKVTTRQAAELIFAASAVGAAPTWTGGTGYTLRQSPANALATEDQVVAATGTFAGTFSFSASDNWSAGVVTFRGLIPASTNITNVFTPIQNFEGGLATKGPNPWIDVTRYGVRAVNINAAPAISGIQVTCTLGSASVTLNSASIFQNGDGVVLQGCGSPSGMNTPSISTVTSGTARTMTGVNDFVAGPSGSTTYNYKVFFRNKFGGYSASSATTSTRTGQASLGSQSVSVLSCSFSNSTISFVTALAHTLAVGSKVYVAGSNNVLCNGTWQVATVPSNTQFTVSQGYDTRNGRAQSGTGGTATWWNLNHVAFSVPASSNGEFQAFVCSDRGTPGTFNLIGMAWPISSATSTQNEGSLGFDDYGSTMMSNVASQRPWYIPSTCPSGAGSNNLVTTIVSGAGTTGLILATTAGSNASSVTIRFDDTPNIISAAQASSSTTLVRPPLYFPFAAGSPGVANSYVVNSVLDLSAANTNLNVFTGILGLHGGLQVNDTVVIDGNAKWYGDRIPGNLSADQFQQYSHTSLGCAVAPCVYEVSSGYLIEGLRFGGTGNGALLFMADGGFNHTFLSDQFSTGGGSTDLMSIGLLLRGEQSANGAAEVNIRDTNFLTGPANGQDTASNTPVMYCYACGVIGLTNTYWATRGGLIRPAAAGSQVYVNTAYINGGNTPLFTVAGNSVAGNTGASLTLRNVLLDTLPHALLSVEASAGSVSAFVTLENISAPGSGLPVLTGLAASDVFMTTVAGPLAQNANVEPTVSNGTAYDNLFISGLGASGAYPVKSSSAALSTSINYPIFVQGPSMSAPTCSKLAGGSMSIGTHTVQISPVWWNGGWGQPSAIGSCATTSGFQSIQVNWINPGGNPKGYQLFLDGKWAKVGSCPYPPNIPSGTTLTQTLTMNANCGGMVPPTAAGGPTMLMPGNQGISTPSMIVGGDSPFTASPRAEQSVFLPGALTSRWTGSSWTLDKAITVTRVQVQAKTAPSGCGTNAVVRLSDGTNNVNVTVNAASNDSGAISQNYAAAAILTIGNQTAAAGCGTSPADAMVVIQYRMQ